MLSVTLGSTLLFGVFLLQNSLSRGIEHSRHKLGADLLIIPANTTIDPESALFAGSPIHAYMPCELVNSVKQIPGVIRVEAQFFTRTLKLACCSGGSETRLVGVEESTLRRLGPLSGDSRPALAADEVVLGIQLFGGVGHAGSRVEILGKIFRIAWRLDATNTSLDHSILLPLDSARLLAAQSEDLRAVWEAAGAPPTQLVSALLVETAKSDDNESVAQAIEHLGTFKVIRAGKTFQRIKLLLDAFVLVLVAASVVTAVGGIAHILAHNAAAAWDRKGEWALYRALGASRPRILRLIAGEAALMVLAGVLPGVPGGVALHHFALAKLAATNAIPLVSADAGALFTGMLGVLGLYGLAGAGAAVLPALRIARLEPASVMAEGDVG